MNPSVPRFAGRDHAACGAFSRAPGRPPAACQRPTRGASRRSRRYAQAADQHWFRPQAVTINQVQDGGGTLWKPDPAGDVLLLGDSFTNVFSWRPWAGGSGGARRPARAARWVRRDRRDRAERRRRLRDPARARPRARGGRGSPRRQALVVCGSLCLRELAVGDWIQSTGARDRCGAARRFAAAPRSARRRHERRVLVTGAAGEVGRRLVLRLLQAGQSRSRARAARRSGVARLEGLGFEFREGDMRDPIAGRACDDMSVVYHLAAVILARDPRDYSTRQPRRHRQRGRRRRGRGVPPLRLRLVGVGGLPAPHALRARQAGRRGDRRARAPARPHHRAADPGLRRDGRAGVRSSAATCAASRWCRSSAPARRASGRCSPRTSSTGSLASWATRSLRQDLQPERAGADHAARARQA